MKTLRPPLCPEYVVRLQKKKRKNEDEKPKNCITFRKNMTSKPFKTKPIPQKTKYNQLCVLWTLIIEYLTSVFVRKAFKNAKNNLKFFSFFVSV